MEKNQKEMERDVRLTKALMLISNEEYFDELFLERFKAIDRDFDPK
jgi:hypothetical protein